MKVELYFNILLSAAIGTTLLIYVRLEQEVKLNYNHFESGEYLANQSKSGNMFRYLAPTTCTSRGVLKIDIQGGLAESAIMEIGSMTHPETVFIFSSNANFKSFNGGVNLLKGQFCWKMKIKFNFPGMDIWM